MYSKQAKVYEIVTQELLKIRQENIDSANANFLLPKNELILEEFEGTKEQGVVDMNQKSTALADISSKPMDFEIVNSSDVAVSKENENDMADVDEENASTKNLAKTEEIIDQNNKYNLIIKNQGTSKCWCGYQPKHERNLQRHIQTVHEGRRDFPCKVCLYAATSKQILKRHVEGKHQMKLCLTCLQCLSNIDTLNEHVCDTKDMEIIEQRYIRKKTDNTTFSSKNTQHTYLIKCESCQITFEETAELENHLEKVHSKAVIRYKCEFCNAICKNKDEYKIHVDLTHKQQKPNINILQKPKVICEVCNITLKDKEEYKIHFNSTHSTNDLLSLHKTKIICEICNTIFNDKKEYRRHFISTHSQKIKCEICNKILKDEEDYKLHFASTHKNIKIICEICNTILKDKEDYKIHFNSTHKKKITRTEQPCNICGKTFTAKSELQIHIWTDHENQKPSSSVHSRELIKCEICNTILKDKEEYKTHFNSTHKKEMYQPCNICGKMFTTKSELQIHIWLDHEKQKNSASYTNSEFFKCNICTLQFAEQQLLDQHVVNFHEKELVQPSKNVAHTIQLSDVVGDPEPKKPKITTYNERISNLVKQNRKVPIQIYNTNIFALQCQFCDLRFSKQDVLDRHIRCVHEGLIKNAAKGKKEILSKKSYYECTKCHKIFEKLPRLRNHTQIFHDRPKSFSCAFCGRIFLDLEEFIIHNKTCKELPKTRHQRPAPDPRFVFVKGQSERYMNNIGNQSENDGEKMILSRNKCQLCPDSPTFESENRFMIHIFDVHEGLKHVQCHSCKKGVNIKDLGMQIATVDELKEFELFCDSCNNSFKVFDSLQKFIQKAMTKDKDKNDGTIHEEQKTGEKVHEEQKNPVQLSCYLCTASQQINFESQSHLDIHIMSIHGKQFSCEQCEKYFDENSELEIHIKKIHQKVGNDDEDTNDNGSNNENNDLFDMEVDLQCDICEEFFCGENNLKIHQEKIHKATTEILKQKSVIIDMVLKEEEETLENNELVTDVKEEKEIKWNFVNRVDEKSKTEIITSTDKNPESKISGDLAQQATLITQNNKNAEFQCKNCQDVFQSAPQLNLHSCYPLLSKIRNSEETKISAAANLNDSGIVISNSSTCELCDASFEKPSDLKRHLKVAHYSTSHYCNICDIGFKKLHEINKHKQDVHYSKKEEEEKSLENLNCECEICNIGFEQLQELRTHYQDVHHFKISQIEEKTKEILNNKAYSFSNGKKTYTYTKLDNSKKFEEKIATTQILFDWHKCENCDQTFSDLSQLRNHNQTIHELEAQKKNMNIINPFGNKRPTKVILSSNNTKPDQDQSSSHSLNASVHEIPQMNIIKTINPFDQKRPTKVKLSPMIIGLANKSFNKVETINTTTTTTTTEEEVVSNRKAYQCNICQDEFNDTTSLENHALNAHVMSNIDNLGTSPEKKVEDVANQIISVTEKNGNNAMYFNLNAHECQVCKKKFELKQDLELHNVQFHKPKQQILIPSNPVIQFRSPTDLKNIMVKTDRIKSELINSVSSESNIIISPPKKQPGPTVLNIQSSQTPKIFLKRNEPAAMDNTKINEKKEEEKLPITKKPKYSPSQLDRFSCVANKKFLILRCEKRFKTDRDLEKHILEDHHQEEKTKFDKKTINELLLIEYSFSVTERLSTFTGDWKNPSVMPIDLAKAGFIYTGREDNVQCVGCSAEIGDWENGDHPMTIHKDASPLCPFLANIKKGRGRPRGRRDS